MTVRTERGNSHIWQTYNLSTQQDQHMMMEVRIVKGGMTESGMESLTTYQVSKISMAVMTMRRDIDELARNHLHPVKPIEPK